MRGGGTGGADPGRNSARFNGLLSILIARGDVSGAGAARYESKRGGCFLPELERFTAGENKLFRTMRQIAH